MHELNGETRDPEYLRRRAHRDYERAFWEMRGEWTEAQLAAAIAGGYDKPLPFESRRAKRPDNDDDETSGDPADWGVDHRIPIVDFDSTTESTLQSMCDQFRSALVWATRGKNGKQPELMQMGVRMLAIFQVTAPVLKTGMDARLPSNMVADLRNAIGADPLAVGKFFWRPLAWVRDCTSLVAIGKRAYSMIYVMCGDLINAATCAEIGALDKRSRQAANKPIQDFRDSFGGIKALPMRGKVTRQRCKQSQERIAV